MKTSTALILAGAGVLVVYVISRKSTALPLTAANPSTSILGGLGQLLGGAILGAGGTVRAPSSPGVVTSSSSYSAPGIGSNGDSEVAIVRSLDAGGISSYDAQGTADAPVYGIAGLDY